MIDNFLEKKIAILGYGVNNQALLAWLILHGARDITICDKNEKLSNKIDKKFLNIKFNLGEKYLDSLKKFDIVFRTPGISYLHPKIQEAKKQGVLISSQTKLFFQLCKAKIIGITGTKGKGTTSTLIWKMLKDYNESHVYLAGNIGADPFEFIDKLTENDWVVLELSSFQLHDLDISPYIAVVLNITSDHLDYHKDTEEYINAKTNIVRHQQERNYIVVNNDYLTSFRFAEMSKGECWYFSRKKMVDQGAYVRWVNDNLGNRSGEIILKTLKEDFIIAQTDDIKLVGEHNLENICAAITASYLAGVPVEIIKKVVKDFRGLNMRLELVHEENGVKFYNDSASTNPDTTIAAIKSFSAPIILIAGGSSKGANYKMLGEEISKKNIKAVLLMGKTGPEIENNITNSQINITQVESLEQSINIVRNNVKSGDVVVFSPASASFDMFRDYKHRGEEFNKLVRK